MPTVYRVALEGFSAFERSALASYFRLAANRSPAYQLAESLAHSDFAVADADHAGAVQAVVDAGREQEAVFIGGHAPAGATAWMMRPIDPLHVLRELDAMVAMRSQSGAMGLHGAGAPAATARSPRPSPGPLPLRRASDPELPVLTAAIPDPRRQGAPARGHEALLVDDSEIALRFLETRLQPLGLHTHRASTSGKALEMLAQQDYDFVFLDVELGTGSDLDGLALCQHIKRLHLPLGSSHPPVVALISAHHSELDRARGMLAGCDVYLDKPLDEGALQRLLRQHGALPASLSRS